MKKPRKTADYSKATDLRTAKLIHEVARLEEEREAAREARAVEYDSNFFDDFVDGRGF